MTTTQPTNAGTTSNTASVGQNLVDDYVAVKRAHTAITNRLRDVETALKAGIDAGLLDDHLNRAQFRETGLREFTTSNLRFKEMKGRITYKTENYSEATQKLMQQEITDGICKPSLSKTSFRATLLD